MSAGLVTHVHNWKLAEEDGAVFVIDTVPPQYPYICECGAFTHDPETGAPCRLCAPEDYALRGPTILLSGGPFDGKRIVQPPNRSVLLRCDDERVQKIVKYERAKDAAVFKFVWNDWTYPFEERDDV